MYRRLKNRSGQTTAEYAVLIGLVVAALVAMQTYVKRGLQARVKDAGDFYVTNMSTSTDWAAISGSGATLSNQYEFNKFSSRSTQSVLEDYGQSTMSSGGIVNRQSTQRTTQNAGDYRQIDY